MTEHDLIRAARPEDLPSIKRCALHAYQPYVARIGRAPAPMVADFERLIEKGHVSVLDYQGDVVGYVVFFRHGVSVQLENVAVLPDYHGRGYGKKLINEVEAYARKCGVGNVELYTNEAMHENLLIYPALGYQETDRRTEDGFRRVYFRKKV